MENLKINYSLSTAEKFLFPIVSFYGIRHLKKEGCLNKVIGAIELFPILGPLASLIERAVGAIFDKLSKASEVKYKQLKKEWPDWIQTFKANALNYFARLQNGEGVNLEAVDLSLTEEQNELLNEAVKKVNSQGKLGVLGTIHSRNNGLCVFSVNEIPGRIFKMQHDIEGVEGGQIDLVARMDHTATASKVIQEHHLYLLHTPKQEILHLDIDGKKISLLMEQKFDIKQGWRPQEQIFHFCMDDPQLRPFVKECVKQLIILIIKTGYSDVRYDNNPLLMNGQGFCLIDMDCDGLSLATSLITGRVVSGEDGILSCLTSDLLEELIPTLQELLTQEQYKSLNIEALQQKLLEDERRYTDFSKYLKKHKVVTGQEEIRSKIKNPSNFFKNLNEIINKVASQNLGLNVPKERKFFIRDNNQDHELNELKEKKIIFDWRAVKSSSRFAYGYFVWA